MFISIYPTSIHVKIITQLLYCLQYSCLENPMDGGAWWAAVQGVAKSWTQATSLSLSYTV